MRSTVEHPLQLTVRAPLKRRFPMERTPRKRGLDNRERDKSGEIDRKHPNTKIVQLCCERIRPLRRPGDRPLQT